ncbi:hypothetical protein MLDJOKPK_00057 [Salmonella phage SPAsTU]|nr:hypothetical protein MLDJOKPK_00057 [Salmonella phage SPAsTU]
MSNKPVRPTFPEAQVVRETYFPDLSGIIRSIRLRLWCRRYLKPLRNAVPFNHFDKMPIHDYLLEYGDKKKVVVSWDQVAVRDLSRIFKVKCNTVGTWEYWSDPDDNPSCVHFATPGVMLPEKILPAWMIRRGHKTSLGIFFPIYVLEPLN